MSRRPELLHGEPEQCFALDSEFGKRRAREALDAVPVTQGAQSFELVLRRRVELRTLQQNDLLHAVLDDIAAQAQLGGKMRSAAVWKEFLCRLLLPTNDEPLASGEVRQRRTSTTQLDRARFSLFIEQVRAFGAEQGVRFGERGAPAVAVNRRELQQSRA